MDVEASSWDLKCAVHIHYKTLHNPKEVWFSMISYMVPKQIIRHGVLVKFRETSGFILCNFINNACVWFLVEFVLNVPDEPQSTKNAPV